MPLRTSVVLLLAAGILTGCGKNERGLRILTLTDLTGPQSAIGQGIRMAAGLALLENQAALLDAGWRVDVTAFDTYASSQNLSDAVSQIASQPDAFCAVVHTDTAGNSSAEQILHTAGIPTILPLETTPLSAGGGHAETVWLSADDQTHGAAAAEWAAANADSKIFLLTDSNRHAQAVGKGFLHRAEDLGLTVSVFPFSAGEDPSDWIPSFKSAAPQTVFFSGSSRLAGSTLGALEGLTFQGSFFFAESEAEDRLPKDFFSETIRLFFSPAAEHSEDFAKNSEFADKFRNAYEVDPPDLSALGYDAAAVCIQSLLKADGSDPSPSSLRARIISRWQSGEIFAGITGDFSPARGRPCRIPIFTRSPNTESPWTPVVSAGTMNGAEDGCGRAPAQAG